MTTSKTPKAPVVLVIPAVNQAWLATCKVGKASADINRKAIIELGKVVMAQSAPMTSIAKSIEDTGKTSSIKGLTYGKVKGLPTFVALATSKAHKDAFNAMELDKALTFACKSYDLLGKGKGEAVDSFENLVKLLDDAQAEKTRKAKEPKAPKDTKEPKAKASDLDALKAFRLLVESFTEVSDEMVEIFNEVQAIFEQKSFIEA